ncbi:hypothetical protein BAE44_0019719 [Dichanthelium oligosanthes]|uniref:Protein NUCLEAR FUSION DEFECTIVE 6, chloroplastic/mitochondrial n=1 Tax=Dichanthelium oligosanthes TaxID=888268 RepID=A0A1E5V277_9POAL|nr:hypothetical protein BAE44_0019719 [Dichanthelium oligosanthes]
MAASTVVLRSRVLARAVSSSFRRSILGAQPHPPSSLHAASPSPSAVHRYSSLTSPGFFRFSSHISPPPFRLPSVCGGLLSVMPLHSAVASARLRSGISPESQSWGVVPQGAALAGFSFWVLPYCNDETARE